MAINVKVRAASVVAKVRCDSCNREEGVRAASQNDAISTLIPRHWTARDGKIICPNCVKRK